MNPGDFVNQLSLETLAKEFPKDALVYVILGDRSLKVCRCVDEFRMEFIKTPTFSYIMKPGARIDGVDTQETVPMIMAFINKTPISGAQLPSDLNPFFDSVKELAAMILGDPESYPES